MSVAAIFTEPHNPNRWRIHERKHLAKYFGPIDEAGEFLLARTRPSVAFWKLHTERTTRRFLDGCKIMADGMTALGIPHINNPHGWIHCHAKDRAFETWGKEGIPCPEWFTFDSAEQYFDADWMALPFLLRINNSCTAEHSYLIRTENELEPALRKLTTTDVEDMNRRYGPGMDRAFMCVEFIDAVRFGCRYSYRIIVAGDKVIFGNARPSIPAEWAANDNTYTPDMEEAFVKLNQECGQFCIAEEKLIIRAAHSLGLNFVGLDVVFDNDGNPFFLEAQIDFCVGNPRMGDVPPYYNPREPALVKFLMENEEMIKRELPMFYYNWLDKEHLFDLSFAALKESFVNGTSDV